MKTMHALMTPYYFPFNSIWMSKFNSIMSLVLMQRFNGNDLMAWVGELMVIL
jgi:hypothetical protein